jgi:hypothetical protein
MRLDIYIVGQGSRSCEVNFDRNGHCTSGYWLDDETDLTEADLGLVQESCESVLRSAATEARLDVAYDTWKGNRFG